MEPKIIEDFYKNREPRVYDETAPTIRAEREGLKVIVASRGGSKPKDLTNKRFGKLVAIKNTGEKKNQSYVWDCTCDCGNKTNVNVKDLQSGHTKSCGCLIAENHFKDHGMTGTRIYSIWKDMRQRCNNPNNQAFKHYGERGIKVCSEWDNDFQDFYDWAMVSGYNDELSIDRIDNDGDYEPSNCRWVTQKEQMNNTRSNKYISYNGITKTLTEWSDETEVPTQVISYRIKEGWDLKRALYEPSKLGKNQYSKPIICASRGRNPENPSDRKQGIELEQRLEPNSEGICNTLTSVQKDNLLIENCYDFYNNKLRTDKCTGTITTNSNATGSGVFGVIEPTYRIRKLTPKECWRLMSFTDEDFHKAEEVNSNTQLYKQAGNAICVNVLEEIFKKLL